MILNTVNINRLIANEHGHHTILLEGRLMASDDGGMSLQGQLAYSGEYTDITAKTRSQLKSWLGY